jgi:hypothetical protein
MRCALHRMLSRVLTRDETTAIGQQPSPSVTFSLSMLTLVVSIEIATRYGSTNRANSVSERPTSAVAGNPGARS